MKLYIYCGLNIHNSNEQYVDKKTKMKTYGTFYQSLKTISENLIREDDVKKQVPTIKTISDWFKELKKLHLIEKYHLKLNIASTIYVKPVLRIRDLKKYEWITELDRFEYIGNINSKVLHHKSCTYIQDSSNKMSKINSNFGHKFPQ